MKAPATLAVLAACSILASCNWMFTDLGPMNPPCDEKVVREYPSPDGTRKAVEYHSTCEANTYVGTIEIAERDGSGRATAMHANFHERMQSPAWPELQVEWKSASELWISYPAGVDAQCISSPAGGGSHGRAGFAHDGAEVAVHCLDASLRR